MTENLGRMTGFVRPSAPNVTWVHALLSFAVPAVLPLSLAGGVIGRWTLKGGQVSRLLIASSREYIADAESARWTQNPAALASALLKVDGRHRIASARPEDDARLRQTKCTRCPDALNGVGRGHAPRPQASLAVSLFQLLA